MQPLTIITGILLGTTASLAFGLLIVAFITVLIGDEAPQLASELSPLLINVAIFSVLTAFCALGFLGVLRRKPWASTAQAIMWSALLYVGWHFWPN